MSDDFLHKLRKRTPQLEQAMLTAPSHSRAEFFALQISGYSKAVEGFVRDSDQAAKLIWAAACALLEVGLLIGALQHSANPA